jgi:hypothetical protein
MDELYEYILEGLRNSSQTKQNENEFIAYLQSLQVEVKNLRQSYRNNSVSVNYSRAAVQAAYLITYYPQYAEMTRHILEQVELSHKTLFLFEQKYLEVCLFGAGAAPEAVGLVSFLGEYYPNLQSLSIRVYDIYAHTWKISQRITQNIIPKFWQGEFTFSTEELDFCQSNSFHLLDNAIANSQMFIFQNCLNELKNPVNFNENIRYLLTQMPINSLLIMGDLRIYQKTSEFQIQVKKLLQELEFERQILCVRHSEMLDFRSAIAIPAIITKNLLTGSFRDRNNLKPNDFLIPRTQIKCNFISVYKTYKHEILYQDLEQLTNLVKRLQTNRNLQQKDRNNLVQQIKLLRILLIAMSAIALIALILSIIAIMR